MPQPFQAMKMQKHKNPKSKNRKYICGKIKNIKIYMKYRAESAAFEKSKKDILNFIGVHF